MHMRMVWRWNGRSAIPEIDRVVSTVRSANGMNSPVAFVIIDGLKKTAATQMAARRTPGRASIPPGFGRVQMCPQTHRAADREALLPRSGSRPRRLPTPTWGHRTAKQRCSYRPGRQACGPRLAPRLMRPGTAWPHPHYGVQPQRAADSGNEHAEHGQPDVKVGGRILNQSQGEMRSGMG